MIRVQVKRLMRRAAVFVDFVCRTNLAGDRSGPARGQYGGWSAAPDSGDLSCQCRRDGCG
jgi:hypothetical protein